MQIVKKVQKVVIVKEIQKVVIVPNIKMESLGDEKYRCFTCKKEYHGFPSAQCNCYENYSQESEDMEDSQEVEESQHDVEEESQEVEEESDTDLSAVSVLIMKTIATQTDGVVQDYRGSHYDATNISSSKKRKQFYLYSTFWGWIKSWSRFLFFQATFESVRVFQVGLHICLHVDLFLFESPSPGTRT